MKTVLHLAKYYFPVRGGIESATGYIAENSDTEYFHYVITNGYGEARSNISKAKILSTKYFSLGSQPISFGYSYKYLIYCRKADIVHYHHPNYWAALMAILFRSKALIIHWHADVNLKNRVFKFFLRRLEKILVTRADKIIIGTKTYASHSTILSGFERKFEIVPYGIPELSNNVDILEKDNILLTVGRLVPYKGIPELIQKIEIPKGWIWIIIGSGPDKQRIQKAIRERDLDSQILLKGRLDDGELEKIYSKSKIFLFPSLTRKESYGIVQVEAMKNGLAIINFKINGSGVPELIISGGNGYACEYADYEILNKNVNQLCSMPELLISFQERSLSLFKERYLIQSYQSEIERIYNEVSS